MRILFIHQNFPAQFRHLAPALVARGHDVVALVMQKGIPANWNGVRVVTYGASRGSTPGIHPWLVDFETKVIRGDACFRAMLRLKQAGFTPDVVIAHPGWGESLFVKEVWPKVRLGIYCEFYYRLAGGDVGFDPEFPSNDAEGDAPRLMMKNLNNSLHFQIADAGLSPTSWQADTFPEPFRSKITVVHDGIDTSLVVPDHDARFRFPDGTELSRQDEVVTFVNRNLEPYRGYHIFMRALPELLRSRPKAQVVIVGGDQLSYGARPPEGNSWRDVFAEEVRPQIAASDWERVRFVGKLPYPQFISLLQVSTVHVYLTYPFVLSWSLLEAMSAGCAIVASATAPVIEAVRHGDTGRLVGFFDSPALAAEIGRLLGEPAERKALGGHARAFAQEYYNLKSVCLPKQLEWVTHLASL